MTLDSDSIPLLKRPFYFLRHGESRSNVDDTIAGSIDVPLTERGRAQASAAARALENRNITAIHSSALSRARETAETIAAALDLPLWVVDELAERRWGVLEGKPRSLRVPGVTPPGAETPEEFTRRIASALAKIQTDGTPLIVAHSGVFRVLCRMLGVAEPAQSESRLANARPARFIPPEPLHPRWRLELL